MHGEDLKAYVEQFGIDVIIRFGNGDEIPIKAIFDDAFFNTQLGEIEIDMSKPRLTCVYEDVLEVIKEDIAIINGVEYFVVKKPQPDGLGMALIILSKSND